MNSFTMKNTLSHFDSAQLPAVLQNELVCYSDFLKILQGSMQQGNYALPDGIKTSILSKFMSQTYVTINVSIFYKSAINGCQCADDPSSAVEFHEYCEIGIEISRETANAIITVK